MRVYIFAILVIQVSSLDGNTTNSTTNTTNATEVNTTTPGVLRGTTTAVPSTTIQPTSTTTQYSSQTTTQTSYTTTTRVTTSTTRISTTTGAPIVTTTMTPIPWCTNETWNTSCVKCIGPLCKFVEKGEQGVGWEILFVAAFCSLVGMFGLCLYYRCIKPVLYHNVAEEIYWSGSDEDEFDEATPINMEVVRGGNIQPRAFEIIDLNPVRKE